MSRKVYVACAALILIPVTLGYTFFGKASENPLKNDPCFELEKPGTCLIETAHHIAMGGDIEKALSYAITTAAADSRIVSHVASHMVGMEAYQHFKNRAEAMKILPPDAMSRENYTLYEGYQHGLLMGYFKTEQTNTPLRDLVRESCEHVWVAENAPTEEFGLWEERRQCFHAVGHGLMHALGNDLQASFAECKKLPHPWMQERCAFGASMENQYLYDPTRDPSAPRPSVRGESMKEVCDAIPDFKYECALFIGRSYFSAHIGDFGGSFAACSALPDPQYAAPCRQQIAFIYVTSAGTDFPLMVERCTTAGDENYLECLSDVAFGVAAGYAGLEAQKRDFCAELKSPLDVQCRQLMDAKKCGPETCNTIE